MPARKRAASPAADETRRRSRRISSTPKRSKYFEEDDDEDEDVGGDGGFDDDAKISDDEEEQEEEEKPVKRGRGRPKGAVGKPKAKANAKKQVKPVKRAAKKQKVEEEEDVEDEYQDEKPEEDDDDEEEEEEHDANDERKVTIIPLEKLRPLGGVEYAEETVHKNTLLFLKDLKANNQRPWLKSHDGEYRRALKDWQSFVETMTEKIAEVDSTIPELPAKDIIFRIHRDIRFSKNPTPYKPHFSAAWSRTGKKGPYACYYIHLEPGSCFVGGGLWCPEAGHLQKLRASIDERPRRWRRVLNDERFKRTFLPKATKKGGEEGALLAFADVNKGNALKKKPMNYSAEHRDIELLKLRNFTISKKIDDQIFNGDDAQEKVCEVIAAMEPFITFLNSVVMPDLNLDDPESDEDEEDDGAASGPPEESGEEEEEEEEEGKDWSTHKF